MYVCALCIYRSLRKPNLLDDPIYGCDIDSSCIPNIIQHFHNIVHFLCHSDCFIFASRLHIGPKTICPFILFICHFNSFRRCSFTSSRLTFFSDSFGHSSSSTCSVPLLLLSSLNFVFTFYSHSLNFDGKKTILPEKSAQIVFVNVNQMRWKKEYIA